MKFRLLTDESANVKLAKAAGSEFYNVGLSLAPHSLSGFNVCRFSTEACRACCVAFSGNGNIPNVLKSRIARTKWLFRNKKAFMRALKQDLQRALSMAKCYNKKLAVRLNVFSDLDWERICPELFDEFSEVQFYDYTKNPFRAARSAGSDFPVNYHLTFSRSESNDRDAVELLLMGVNVAVVVPQFRTTEIASRWHGFKMVDGDKSDLRFLDPKGVVVGLRAKGTMRNNHSGFVDRTNLNQNILDMLT